MKSVRRLRLASVGPVAALVLAAAPLVAQSAESATGSRGGGVDRHGGVADRLAVRGGLLFAAHSTSARLDSEALGAGTLVDLEDDLGLDTSTRDIRVEGGLRLGRRHRLRVGFVSLTRGADVQLQRQIQWGDEVFTVDATVASAADLTLVPASYRFSVVKSDRVDLGISAGVFAVFAEASIAAPSLGIAEAESADFPLPVLGADVDIALAPRLFLLGGVEYFALSVEGVDGSWSEIRGAVEYWPHRHVGVGVGYRSVSIEIDGTGALDGAAAATEIFFDYSFRGPQAYLALAL